MGRRKKGLPAYDKRKETGSNTTADAMTPIAPSFRENLKLIRPCNKYGTAQRKKGIRYLSIDREEA